MGRIYNNWYDSASEVAMYVADDFDRLYGSTMLYRDKRISLDAPQTPNVKLD